MNNTWIEISKSALKQNILGFRKLIPRDTKLISVIKANAYGHGLAQVSEIVQDQTDYLAVINLEEARLSRKLEIKTPIIVLGYILESEKDILWAISEKVEIVVNSLSHAERISKIISNSSGGADCLKIHIKIDTGMGRMGIMPENSVSYVKQISHFPYLKIKGIMSHFADVSNHKDYTQEQLKKFEDIKFQLFREKLFKDYKEEPIWHIAKTEAILFFPKSHLDAVRLGIGLYGILPDKKAVDTVLNLYPDFELKPALCWKTQILQIKNYPKEEYVGYGCTYKTKRETRIAILPVGYYEGYDRGLSNKGEVLIRGKRCPIIGRICMNMCMADVTAIHEAKRGDEVVLIGKQGKEEITSDEIAKKLDTVNYEIVARINPKIKRIITE